MFVLSCAICGKKKSLKISIDGKNFNKESLCQV